MGVGVFCSPFTMETQTSPPSVLCISNLAKVINICYNNNITGSYFLK
jgi:hypothetical protein